jgi:pimeloyl-ACP methyl ester carboxylesterase
MPRSLINGINLSYDNYGAGEPVVLVAGTGAPGRVWKTYQVPALVGAGYRAITIDNRGVPPSDLCEDGFTLADLAADVAGLIKFLGLAPCRVIGSSLGSVILQEVLISQPGLVRQAVLMATRGRTDVLGAAASRGELELFDSGIKLPAEYQAYLRAVHGLSRRTLGDEALVRDWLDIFQVSPIDSALGRSQLTADLMPDRLESYRAIDVPCLVLAFADDLMVAPGLCREVAEHIPGSRYQEIDGCGHYGYLEQPELVNAAIIEFFGGA